jgi:hypothetical protein
MHKARTKHVVDPELQGALFDAPFKSGENEEGFPTPIPESDSYEPVTIGDHGSYVNLSERAYFLKAALIAVSKRNQRAGFAIASRKEPYRTPIVERYEEDLPIVIERAGRNEDRFGYDAAVNFWHTTGYAAIRSMARDEGDEDAYEAINARARQQWRQFMREYSGTGKSAVKKRNKYIKKLDADITRADEALRKQSEKAA